MALRAPKQSRGRTRLPQAFQPIVPALTATGAATANKARMTFSLPVTVQALPTGLTIGGLPPTAVTQISATVLDLTFAANVTAGQQMTVPPNQTQIRSASGGTLASGTITF